MEERANTTRLPEHLHRYFWEYDAERLSVEESRHTILLRLLESGGMDALRWLRANVADEELRALLIRRRGRGISPRRLRFWGLMLDLPEDQVDEWVAAERGNLWNRRSG